MAEPAPWRNKAQMVRGREGEGISQGAGPISVKEGKEQQVTEYHQAPGADTLELKNVIQHDLKSQ